MIADKKEPLLRIQNLTVHYGAAQALFGLDLAVAPGETVALVGANGAGKTSLLKAVMGLAPPSGGRIFLDGVDVTGSTPAAMAARGVALCPEGREMFGDLTVRENLELVSDHILYIKAEGNYITIAYLKNGKIARTLFRNTMKYAADLLASNPSFYQSHRSWIVNLNRISGISGNSQGLRLRLESFDEEIPVARNNTAIFKKIMMESRA